MRWVCSTFIPYFATKNDLRNTTNKTDSALSSMKSKTTNLHLVNNIDNKAQKMFKQAQMLEGSNEIKRYLDKNLLRNEPTSLCDNINILFLRSRRKARLEQKRIRIRPCLSVCQTVEQKCPYMLPADRAPAYPTQYAGEPTFLCLGQ